MKIRLPSRSQGESCWLRCVLVFIWSCPAAGAGVVVVCVGDFIDKIIRRPVTTSYCVADCPLTYIYVLVVSPLSLPLYFVAGKSGKTLVHVITLCCRPSLFFYYPLTRLDAHTTTTGESLIRIYSSFWIIMNFSAVSLSVSSSVGGCSPKRERIRRRRGPSPHSSLLLRAGLDVRLSLCCTQCRRVVVMMRVLHPHRGAS